MTRLFVVLSGEHPTIPQAELEAILESEGIQFGPVATYDNVVELNGDEGICNLLQLRSAMVMTAGRLLIISKPSKPAIIRAVRALPEEIENGRTIRVRVKRFRGAHIELGRSSLEREIGGQIVTASKRRIHANLRHPDLDLLGIITNEAFILGEMLVSVDRGAFDRRRPRTRPFFKPGVLEPRIARVFVNLSHANSSKTFYDPFVGTGGFLVEACGVARYAVGSDVDPQMITGAKRNLSHYDFCNYDILQADATRMPIRTVECVGFDPPYGRATSTKKRRTEDLVLSTLSELSKTLLDGSYVVFAFPSNLDVEAKLPKGIYSIINRHTMRVHRSLTRSILVLRRARI